MGEGADHERSEELRRQLELAQAITHIGSWEWTLATGVVTWSDELYRIYGFEPGSQAITLEFFLSRIHPDERERVQREIQAVLRHPQKFAYREIIVRPDGSLRTVDTIGDAIVDENGAVIKLVGTCRDVTDVVVQDERLRFYGDVFEHVDIGLSAWQCDKRQMPPVLRLVAFNAAMERIVGTPLGGKLGQPLASVLPTLAARPELARTFDAAGDVQKVAPFEVEEPSGSSMLSATLFALPGHHLGLALEDCTRSVHARIVQAAERRALEMLAAGEPLPAILDLVARSIEKVSHGTLATILLLDDTGTKVRHGAAPSLPASFVKAIDDQPIGPKAGSCGTAMYRREPVYVVDINIDPLWDDYRAIAREHGVRCCWSMPILGNDGHVLGTFALYRKEPAAPSEQVLELMKRAAHVTGIVLERRALDDALRALAGRIEAVREDERTTIARDIHDQLGQSLTALKLDVGWLQRRIQDEALAEKLDQMARATDEIIRSVRRISADLRPGILDDLGLRAAIEWQADEFEQHTSIKCAVHANLTDVRLERTLATNVFRIFQEALTNVARHAGATQVDVALGLEHGQLRLEVTDDGIGVPEVGPRGTTLGILGMSERARRLGGECIVKRRSPRGTAVTVVVPLRFPAATAG